MLQRGFHAIKIGIIETPKITQLYYVEPTRKNVMIDLLTCLVQGNDVPPACNLLLKSIFLSA